MLQINFISNIISFLFIFLYLGDTFVLNEEYFLGSLILLNLILLNFFINIGIFLPYLKNKISELFIYYVDFTKNKFSIFLNIFWNKIYYYYFIKFLKEFLKLNLLVKTFIQKLNKLNFFYKQVINDFSLFLLNFFKLKEKINIPINFLEITNEKNIIISHFAQVFISKKNKASSNLNILFLLIKKNNFFLLHFKISGVVFNFLSKITNFLILNLFYQILI
jgi:hypothetical protein